LMTIMEACGISEENTVVSKRIGINRNGDLTPREIEILKLLADGYKYREIAEKVFVSLETVKTHTKHIYDKLDVSTKTQAVRRAEDLNIF